MKEFLLVFHADYTQWPEATSEQMQEMTKRWMQWIGEMTEAGKLVDRGNRLTDSGRVVKSGGIVTNGPFMEIKESIGGYTMVRATSYDDAVQVAQGCPILSMNGSVEVREVAVMA